MIVCLLISPLAPTHTRILTVRTIVVSFLLTRAHLHRAMVLFFFLLAGNGERSSYSRKTEDNDRGAVATRLCANETPIARHFTIIVSVGFHLSPLPFLSPPVFIRFTRQEIIELRERTSSGTRAIRSMWYRPNIGQRK